MLWTSTGGMGGRFQPIGEAVGDRGRAGAGVDNKGERTAAVDEDRRPDPGEQIGQQLYRLRGGVGHFLGGGDGSIAEADAEGRPQAGDEAATVKTRHSIQAQRRLPSGFEPHSILFRDADQPGGLQPRGCAAR
ncbi:MAG: hypothetical protein KL785_09200 [Brevundimonas sp.]|nr:hypothetical protein [Brevundimonas sp.]